MLASNRRAAQEQACILARNTRLDGQRFGKLQVLRCYAGCKQGGRTKWLCLCDCGNEKVVASNHLTRTVESTKSCGCLRRPTT